MKEGWEFHKLGDLGTLTSSKRIFKSEYVTEGVPFYRSKEIKELGNGRDISLELYITNERYNEIKKQFGVPLKGDILLTAVGTIGEMYVVDESHPFYFKDGNIMWLKNFDSLDSYFLKYALTLFVEQLKAMSQGSAYSALTIEKLKKYSIPAPPLTEQKQIVALLDKAFAAIGQAKANIEKNIENARELFQSKRDSIFSQNDSGWEDILLKEIIDVKHGFAFKSEFFTTEGDFVLLTPGNYFEEGGYRDRGGKQKYYQGEIPDGYILNRDDLLVAMTEQAAGLLGSPLLVPESNKFLHNQRLGLIRIKEGVDLSNKFLYHVFNTRELRKEIHHTGTGLKVRHTSPTKIGAIKVSVNYNQQVQQRTIELLKNLELATIDMTSKYLSKISNLEELKKSILQKAFSGELTGKEVMA
jgi:type I restriction enzyme S subunit